MASGVLNNVTAPRQPVNTLLVAAGLTRVELAVASPGKVVATIEPALDRSQTRFQASRRSNRLHRGTGRLLVILVDPSYVWSCEPADINTAIPRDPLKWNTP